MIFACVKVGDKYNSDHVRKLFNGIVQHLPLLSEKDIRFVCINDEHSRGLPGWWAKMNLFEPSWRKGEKVIYIDLDVVCVGDLVPLTKVESDFAICDNFARRSGLNWPCRYNSSVMVLGPNLNRYVWEYFLDHKERLMEKNKRYGDQKAIEEIIPNADLLQEHLPEGFFLGWRELYKNHLEKKPENCSMVVFAGSHKPDKDDVPSWVKDEWNAVDLR